MTDEEIIEHNYNVFNYYIDKNGSLNGVPENYELISQELFEKVNSKIIVCDYNNEGVYFKGYFKKYKDIYIAKTIKSDNKKVLNYFINSLKLTYHKELVYIVDEKFKLLNNILTLK